MIGVITKIPPLQLSLFTITNYSTVNVVIFIPFFVF